MPSLTSMGYKKPSNGERGSVFYPALEYNIDRVNDHTHDGTDGQQINCKHLTKTTAALASADWVAVAGQAGTYRQLVTIASGFTLDTTEMKFFINGGGEDGHLIHPSVEKVSSTTFYVYINDNTQGLKVIYG